MPIAPAPLVPASETARLAPDMDHSVIAPPPTFDETASQKTMQAPEASVIAPPPALEANSNRRLSDINIGHSAVIAPAPELSVEAQRAVPSGRSAALTGHAPKVIAPPPSAGVSGGSRSGSEMIALSLHPAVGAPPAPPEGNRRGSFASTPQGHPGASGAPGSSGGDASANGGGSGSKTSSNLPSGLYVGKTSKPTSTVAGDPGPSSAHSNDVNPNLLASARPPRVSRTPSEATANISEAERAVFAGRKVYSLSLNMPNLNSGGGSWVIHFAALKADSNTVNETPGQNSDPGLSSPVATRKVDPAYPLELMRQNVGGTVILYAVIRADGTVGDVRVLRSVDDRLDQFASEAIAKCQFQPSTKNGTPVDVEATFWIPFRPTRTRSNF